MNDEAIKKAAEAVTCMDEQLRSKLSEKQLFTRTYLSKQIIRRKKEESFTLENHIRGMVYSMLSSGLKWVTVEPCIDNDGRIRPLDEIMSEYNPSALLSSDPDVLSDKIKDCGWATQSTRKQMRALKANVQKLLSFERGHGSIDEYYQKSIDEDPTYRILIVKLSKPGSADKMGQMAEALTAEYLRNVGHNISKPDRHIRRILGGDRLGCTDDAIAPIFEAMEAVRQIALLCGKPTAEVDYILWAYCASGYGEICSAKRPKCQMCPASAYCKTAQQSK